jgi:WD40 repeat protein
LGSVFFCGTTVDPANVGQASGGSGGLAYPAAARYASLAYSAKHDRLAVAGTAGVVLFDATTGAKAKTIDPAMGPVALVQQAGDVIAASWLGNMWIIDPVSGAQLHYIALPQQIYALGLSADGAVVVSGGIDGQVHRFRTTDGGEIEPPLLPISHDFVNHVAVSPDGLYLAAATVEGAHVWRASDGTLVTDVPGRANTVAFTPDGRAIAVGTDSAVEVHAVPDGHSMATYPYAYRFLAYSSDGSKLAISATALSVTVLDTATGAPLLTLSDGSPLVPSEGYGPRSLQDLAFVDGDARLAVVWGGGRLTEWRVSDGSMVLSRLDSDRP